MITNNARGIYSDDAGCRTKCTGNHTGLCHTEFTCQRSGQCKSQEGWNQSHCAQKYMINGEKLGLEDITILESEQNNLKSLLEKQRNTQIFSENEKDSRQDFHNTYGLEQKLLHMVRKGDTAALKEWIAHAPAVRGGTLASDQLRQVKNTFIVSATLVSRAAIQGGMETALPDSP